MFNEATIIGRIGKKEAKETQYQKKMCTLSIATKDKRKKNGVNTTTWHYVNCYDKLAENVIQYCDVGDLVLVKGEIVITKTGEQNYYSIHGEQIKFLLKAQQKEKQETVKPSSIEILDDEDIPF